MAKINPMMENGNKYYKHICSISKQKLNVKKKAKKLYLIETGQEITAQNICQLLNKQIYDQLDSNMSISVLINDKEEFQGFDEPRLLPSLDEKCIIRYMCEESEYSREASKQLENCSKLKGMRLAVGQPDLHPGKGYPIGCSLVSQDIIYPYLIGNDIGCGMSLLLLTKNSNDNSNDNESSNEVSTHGWTKDKLDGNVNKLAKLVGMLKNLDGTWQSPSIDNKYLEKKKENNGKTENENGNENENKSNESIWNEILNCNIVNWPHNTKDIGFDVTLNKLASNEMKQKKKHGGYSKRKPSVKSVKMETENEDNSGNNENDDHNNSGNNLDTFKIDISLYNDYLGTIGQGNHFAELQCIDKIVNENLAKECGLLENGIYLMIHSGSRGLGKDILSLHINKYNSKGLDWNNIDNQADFQSYIDLHNMALKWAKLNRIIIGQRFCNDLQCDFNQTQCLIDIYHNYLISKPKSFFKFEENDGKSKENKKEKANENENETNDTNEMNEEKEKTEKKKDENDESKENKKNRENESSHSYWIHRKGAAPSDAAFVVIPGSRGSYSYVVKPKASEFSAYSIAHGAGRQWQRSKAINKMSKWYPNAKVLSRTDKFNSYVVCENKDLMYEEAPQAYKNIDSVINDLVNFDLVDVVAVLRPLITYKTRTALSK